MEGNDLNKLFRKKFRDPAESEMNWVQPDDAIFEQVLQDVLEEEDTKPLYWRWRYGFFLLLLLPFAIGYTMYSGSGQGQSAASLPLVDVAGSDELTPSQPESDIYDAQYQSAVQKLKKQKTTTTNYYVASSDDAFTSKVDFERSFAMQKDDSSEELSKDFVAHTASIGGLYRATHTEMPHTPISGAMMPIVKPHDEYGFKEESIAARYTEQISDLSKISLIYDIEAFEVVLSVIAEHPEYAIIDPIEETFSPSEFLTFGAGPTLSYVSHPDGLLSNEMIMNGHRELQTGWHVGASYARDLSRDWQLRASLAYQRIEMQSHIEMSLFYEIQNEYLDQGELMYTTPMSLITPTTGFEDNVEFVIADAMMADKDLMTNYLDITQNISILSTDFGLSRRLLQKGTFNLSVGAMVGLDYIAQVQEDMSITLMAHDNMLFEKDKTWVNHKGINRWGAHVGLDLMAQWSMASGTSLFVSPAYRRSITRVRASSILEERSYFNIFNVSTGVIHRF